MKHKLKWRKYGEKHDAVYRLIDASDRTRAFVYWDGMWYSVGPLGTCFGVCQDYGSSARYVMSVALSRTLDYFPELR